MAALRVRLLPGSRKRSSRCDRHRMRNCTPLLPPSILRLSRSKSLTRREFPGGCREIKNSLFFDTWNPDLPDSFLQLGALAQELIHTFRGIAIPDPHRVRRNRGDSCSRNAGLDDLRIIARNPGTGGRPPTPRPKKMSGGVTPPSLPKRVGGTPLSDKEPGGLTGTYHPTKRDRIFREVGWGVRGVGEAEGTGGQGR